MFQSVAEILVSIAATLSIVIIIGVCCMLAVLCWDWCHRSNNHLSRRQLNLLQTITFKSNETPYESCAICIEDYVDGEKLRLLPCCHGYHCKCIDPWLLGYRRICPICKLKVWVPGMPPDPDSESDTDVEQEATERTPLLTGDAGRGRSNSDTSSPVIPMTMVSTEAASGDPMSSGDVTTATFHREDEAPSPSRSSPTTTHVSTTSVDHDSETKPDDEEEAVVRYARPGGSSGSGAEGVIAFTLKW